MLLKDKEEQKILDKKLSKWVTMSLKYMLLLFVTDIFVTSSKPIQTQQNPTDLVMLPKFS